MVLKETGGGGMDKRLTEMELEHVTSAHNFQRMYQRTYQHMLDRMKKDLIALTLTINDLTNSLRSKQQIYERESASQLKARQNNLQSKYKLDLLMKNIDHE